MAMAMAMAMAMLNRWCCLILLPFIFACAFIFSLLFQLSFSPSPQPPGISTVPEMEYYPCTTARPAFSQDDFSFCTGACKSICFPGIRRLCIPSSHLASPAAFEEALVLDRRPGPCHVADSGEVAEFLVAGNASVCRQVNHGMFVVEANAETLHVLVCEAVTREQHRLHVIDEGEGDSAEKRVQWHVIDLKRRLSGAGAHRQLRSNIMWRRQRQPDWRTPSKDRCSVTLIEELPEGIFGDEYELQRLKQRGVFEDVYVLGDRNIELSAIHSNRSTVEVRVLASVWEEGDAVLAQAHVALPLHSRYPPLSADAHYPVSFSIPDVFLTCSKGHGLEPLPHDKTAFREQISGLLFGGSLQFALRSMKWPIPSGNPAHLSFISCFTMFSAALGVILVFYFSHLSFYTSRTHVNPK